MGDFVRLMVQVHPLPTYGVKMIEERNFGDIYGMTDDEVDFRVRIGATEYLLNTREEKRNFCIDLFGYLSKLRYERDGAERVIENLFDNVSAYMRRND